jgi:hypothetical protein
MEAAVPPRRVFKKWGRLPLSEDFFGVEPIHPAAALGSRGMDAAVAGGPR